MIRHMMLIAALLLPPATTASSVSLDISIIITHATGSPGIPPGLPDYFTLGVRSTPGDLSWMTTSGVPWDYRYTYVNPGWKTAESGQFIQNYASNSYARNLIPVYTWYEMSNGFFTGMAVAQLTSLNTPGTMNTYFGDYVLLLQRIVASNPLHRPVIVHLEPDLWGFIQQNSWDPTATPAAVASSGFSGLSTLPNNAAGFAKALVRLRDTYAPEVILAWHASLWGPNNGYSPTRVGAPDYQSAVTTGNAVGDFYNALGASFNLIFHDTSDMDAGFYVANCDTGQNIHRGWWNDAAFINFRQYLGAIYTKTGVRSTLWQTPEGNTLYRTQNNTTYHYQDNRPEYFLTARSQQHIVEFAGVGVIGILFGLGQQTPYSQCNSSKSATDHADYAGDGITNPAAINGNTLISSVSDDDGGFLRINAAAYYTAPVHLP